MPLIKQGSCIGILYFSSSGTGACLNYDSGWVCVHNGKFNYALYSSYKQKKYGKKAKEYHLNTPVPVGQMPDAICIGHWAKPNLPQANQLFTGIADVHLTPDLHSPNNFACEGTRKQYQGVTDPKIIVPGNCVGIHFYEGKEDIKNGRYLFWLDAQQMQMYKMLYPKHPPGYPHRCLIDYNKNYAPSYNSFVYYFHYNIRYNPATKTPEIYPEIKYRTNIKSVFKTMTGNCP